MRRLKLFCLLVCISVILFVPYVILTVFLNQIAPERLSVSCIQDVMKLRIDRDGFQKLAFEYPVSTSIEDSWNLPKIPDVAVMVKGPNGLKLTFEDLVQLDPRLIKLQLSKEVYNLFPVDVDMKETIANISRKLPISTVSILETYLQSPLKSELGEIYTLNYNPALALRDVSFALLHSTSFTGGSRRQTDQDSCPRQQRYPHLHVVIGDCC